MPDLATFLRAITRDPAALGPLADWLDERGERRDVAALLRTSLTKRPAYRPRRTQPGKFGWFWDKRLLSWTPDGPSILPVEVHNCLPGRRWNPLRRNPIHLGTAPYGSEREAWAALAVAFVDLLGVACGNCRGTGVCRIWPEPRLCEACNAFGFVVPS